jgi:pimeloyl-ACP methyl ester carboxylesterase
MVLLIHGLGGSKSVLIQLATELSHAGFDCTSIDLPGHGASADVFTWNRALGNTMSIVSDLLSERSSGAQPRLFLVGHSLGASIAIRAGREDARVAGVIAISPAIEPVTLDSPHCLLILSGEYDFPFVRRGAAFLYEAATGATSIPTKGTGTWENESHTRKLTILPWTDHSLGIFKPRSIEEIENWIAAIDPGGPHTTLDPTRYLTRTLLRIFSCVLLLTLWFPLTGSVAAILHVKRDSRTPDLMSTREWSRSRPLTLYAIAGVAAVLVLGVFNPWRHLGLMGGAYLTGFLCLLGLLGCVFVKPALGQIRPWVGPSFFAIAALLLLVICVAPSFTRQVVHLELETHRLWRLPWVLASLAPFFLFDELLLSYQVRQNRWWQTGLFYVSSRLVIALLLLVGFLTLRSSQFLIILMFPGLLAANTVLWLLARWIQHLTGSTVASFVFSSLSTAWFVCVFFNQI